MSVKVMSMVWEDFPGGGADLLALLALADWSDDEGRCFPAMSSIAAKVRLSRSQAQRVVHRLIEMGFVTVTGNETGGAPGSSRRYKINISKLTGRMDATGSAHATGRTDAQDGSHGCGETGRTGAARTISEPSVNRQREASASPLSADWALPEDWKTEAVKLRPTWTPDFVDEMAASFRDYFTGGEGQGTKKLNWRSAWREWVRREKREGVLALMGVRTAAEFRQSARCAGIAFAETAFSTCFAPIQPVSLINIKEAGLYTGEPNASTKTAYFLGFFHLLGSSLREITHAET